MAGAATVKAAVGLAALTAFTAPAGSRPARGTEAMPDGGIAVAAQADENEFSGLLFLSSQQRHQFSPPPLPSVINIPPEASQNADSMKQAMQPVLDSFDYAKGLVDTASTSDDLGARKAALKALGDFVLSNPSVTVHVPGNKESGEPGRVENLALFEDMDGEALLDDICRCAKGRLLRGDPLERRLAVRLLSESLNLAAFCHHHSNHIDLSPIDDISDVLRPLLTSRDMAARLYAASALGSAFFAAGSHIPRGVRQEMLEIAREGFADGRPLYLRLAANAVCGLAADQDVEREPGRILTSNPTMDSASGVEVLGFVIDNIDHKDSGVRDACLCAVYECISQFHFENNWRESRNDLSDDDPVIGSIKDIDWTPRALEGEAGVKLPGKIISSLGEIPWLTEDCYRQFNILDAMDCIKIGSFSIEQKSQVLEGLCEAWKRHGYPPLQFGLTPRDAFSKMLEYMEDYPETLSTPRGLKVIKELSEQFSAAKRNPPAGAWSSRENQDELAHFRNHYPFAFEMAARDFFTRDELVRLREEYGLYHLTRYPTDVLRHMLDEPARVKDRRLCVMVYADADHNGALASSWDLANRLHEYLDLRIIEADSESALINGLEKMFDRFGAIDALILQGHGTPECINLGCRYRKASYKDQDELYLDLTDDAVILRIKSFLAKGEVDAGLIACLTGSGENSLAEKLSDSWDMATVFAPYNATSPYDVVVSPDGRLEHFIFVRYQAFSSPVLDNCETVYQQGKRVIRPLPPASRLQEILEQLRGKQER